MADGGGREHGALPAVDAIGPAEMTIFQPPARQLASEAFGRFGVAVGAFGHPFLRASGNEV
jgi:hypothetical protein